ncbi:alkane 1-monooxygenase [Pimelobacter simplex]|nr:fatty acid desaturase [Pimelobacter simplex]MCG8150571.1 alkane 1-monooxygenase [Pimelobacter simplex]GEB15093.1 alkane 1-monooxygenase [Pimelobacter simplex]SFM86513.1 alkane 1-monooxygenase [Pimelobacter simplex]
MTGPTIGATVPEGSTEEWKDKKRYLWLLGLMVPGLGIMAVVGWLYTDWVWLLLAGPLLVNVIIPVLDLAFGLDPSNPPDDVMEELENDRYYRWVVFMYMPAQFLILFAGFALIAGINPVLWFTDLVGATGWVTDHLGADVVRSIDMAWYEKVFLAVSIAGVQGIGINTAHELGHKKESVERWLSKIALAPTFYGHFYIEHNRGHHVRVATPEDPASSRLGESFWAFWPRTVSGSLKSAWEVEAKRYRRKNTHPFHLGNDVLNAWLMSVVVYGAMFALYGWQIAPYALITIVFGFSLLEIINYLEHYGMKRQKVGAKQRYERVLPMHSWNSNNIVTNIFLYHLQRHSDHHANPTRRYQTLRDFKESPALPTGYAGMLTIALFPPLWRRVMDHRVVQHLDGDVTLANIQPGKEAKYLAKFPPPADHAVKSDDLFAQQFVGEVLAARCPGCSYVYDVAAGDEHEGFAAGTAWSDIPDDWCCPDCGVREKIDFIPFDPEKIGA